MVLCLGEPPRRFLLLTFHFHFVVVSSFHFYFILFLLFFICRCSSFTFTSRHHLSLFRGLFYTFSPAHCRLIRDTFISTFPGSSYREHYGFECAFFTHRRFLLYAPSPTFLTQLAFIKASLGVGSSSLKFARLHNDLGNTDPAHLFV